MLSKLQDKSTMEECNTNNKNLNANTLLFANDQVIIAKTKD
jgi:hypothetical protein